MQAQKVYKTSAIKLIRVSETEFTSSVLTSNNLKL